MSSWKIELRIKQALIPAIEDILCGLDLENFPTITDFEIIEGEEIRLMEAYFLTKPDLGLFQERLALIYPDVELDGLDLTLIEVEDKDWVSESQKLLHPVDAGLFFVYGSHDADKIPDNRISLLVEAGQAFGTGQHETTHGCLLAIGDLYRSLSGDQAPKTALDLGCGSGLLAMAMSRLWPITIVASDIDPIATETTQQNALANHIDRVGPHSQKAGIAAITSDGFDDSNLCESGPYDVIVANILAKPLQDMAADIVANLSPDGSLILSGLLGTQEDAVMSSYGAQGMKLITRYPRGDWHSLLLKRK